MRLVFDHGTILLGDAPSGDFAALPGVRWDPRVRQWRAPGRSHAAIVQHLEAHGLPFHDAVWPRAPIETGPWKPLELRPYQQAALMAWTLAGQRGIAALPTGSGKTRLAIAAMSTTRLPVMVLVPTRALLHQWLAELRGVYAGALGCLGDGNRLLAPVCVATFESAYRHMARVGRLYAFSIIDEVHHFGAGLRDEALEMSIAGARLGLTATPPGDAAIERLAELVGPIVYQLAVADLAGRWLANFDLVVVRLPLTPDERRRHDDDSRAFKRAYRAFARTNPGGSWQEFNAVASASEEGRAALAAWRRARSMLGLTTAKRAMVRDLLARHEQSRVLIFTGDNAAAYAIAREHLIMPITCNMTKNERQSALERFKQGKLRALVSARVLNEGINVPDADVAILVAGSHGEREYVQRIGRLLRPREGKRATIYELVSAGTSETRQAVERRKGLGQDQSVVRVRARPR